MNKLLYSRKEVAVLIGLSLASVESLTASGQLRSIRVGRSVRVSAVDLEAFCKTGTSNRTVTGKDLDPQWQSRTTS